MSERKYKLRGFINPFGIKPSFLIPVFHRKGNMFVQEIDGNARICGFLPLESQEIPGELVNANKRLSVTEEIPAVYAFVFGNGDLTFGMQEELFTVLSKRLEELKKYPFIYMDVLNFLGDFEESRKAIFRIRNILSHASKDIADELTNIELRLMETRSATVLPKSAGLEVLKYADAEGSINYWNLHDEIENLIEHYSRVYVRLRLIRSRIGLSPKVKNVLESFGLASEKINSVGRICPVDVGNLKRLKQIRKNTIIVEVRVFGESEIIIKPHDELAVRKRYLKKDPRKVTKGEHHRDYICEIVQYDEQSVTR